MHPESLVGPSWKDRKSGAVQVVAVCLLWLQLAAGVYGACGAVYLMQFTFGCVCYTVYVAL